MIRAGFETVDPRTGTRVVVVEADAECAGRGWMLEVDCPPGAAAAIPEHLHLSWTETFEILDGAAACRLDGRERELGAGDVVVMPPGVPHVHPWNTGPGPLRYRQVDDFGAPDPTAVREVVGVFATLNDLAREGRVGRNGLPRHPLRAVATLRTLTRHGGFDAAVPVPAQRAVAATFGRLAEALGYHGADPRYTG